MNTEEIDEGVRQQLALAEQLSGSDERYQRIKLNALVAELSKGDKSSAMEMLIKAAATLYEDDQYQKFMDDAVKAMSTPPSSRKRRTTRRSTRRPDAHTQ